MIDNLLTVANAAISLAGKTKAAKKVQVDIHSAADILVLAGAIQDRYVLDSSRRGLFQPGRTSTAPLPRRSAEIASTATFDFQAKSVVDSIAALNDKVDKLASALTQKPTQTGARPSASYALAASKHAPAQQTTKSKPTSTDKRSPPLNQRSRLANTITLLQVEKTDPECTNLSTRSIVRSTSLLLRERNIRLKDSDAGAIQVKAAQWLPLNNLVIHLETPAHAKTLKDRASEWLAGISGRLTIKPDVHAILVHGIPT